MARTFSGTFLPANPSGAGHADAGDCFSSRGRISCLPGLVNIGVQKAGTGELQTWLSVHPRVTVHGGEAHFFDRTVHTSLACSSRHRASLRLRYSRFLWRRRQLRATGLQGQLLYEKTPAYFDRVRPQHVQCAVPSARLLVMLRLPAERARSAYAMCQRELEATWCRDSFEVVLGRVLVVPSSAGGANGSLLAAPPHVSRRALRREPHLKRMLLMGQYAVFLRRWLDAYSPAQLRVLWLEQFKRDPFACMRDIEAFAGLPHHPYRSVARLNAAGLYVVGPSKSTYEKHSQPPGRASSAATPSSASSKAAAMELVRAFYAPWQRRLATLLAETNTTLVHEPPPPL